MPAHLVDEHLAAFNAHDSARLLAGLAEDAQWATGQDVFRGREALADLFDESLWAMEPTLEQRTIVVGDDAAATELMEELTVDGEQRRFAIAVFFRFADGLITHATVYREGSADIEPAGGSG
jgi:ketosteroid isomerase-like protein